MCIGSDLEKVLTDNAFDLKGEKIYLTHISFHLLISEQHSITYKSNTYMTGNTLANTTDASARYSYNICISFSSVVFLTNVAYFKIFEISWYTNM